ncbi:MAG TPA: GreA/GreB family elongation factor [Thermoanaerobaculia bacterium]|jgi:transcription elongation factor GreA-like protein/transcription elongation GreA/GreB family factor|nr:GreA/GreB family elongation factor [Thermoanaerobaculia bacterium]
MPFREDANALIQKKKFDDFEALWMTQLDSDPSDVEMFLTAAKALRKAEQRSQSDTLLGLLADAQKEKGLWAQRLQILKELGRLSKHPATMRPQIEEALRKSLGDHKNFNRAFAFANFNDPPSNPIERAEKIEMWLMYDEGECFFMNGRGAGVVVELNPELGVCRVDFENDKRVPVPLGAAAKALIPLPKGHVLREKFTDGERLKAAAKQSPSEFFARILKSFGRPMVMAEVRDSVIGIVPEEKWSSWWTAARKNTQVVTSGTGAKATYAFAGSEVDAATAIRRDFDRADVKTKLELARKHSARGKELADAFSTALAAEAARLARTDAGTAWLILTTLESLPGKYESPIEPASLLTGPMASRTIAGMNDKPMREKALAVVRTNHPEWPKVYAESFFLDDEPRILTSILAELEATGHTDVRDRLIDETLRYPRRHPRAFFWYVKRLNEDESMADKATYAILFQILDALTNDEFSGVRARLKDLFDKGGLAVRIVMNQNNEEQARRLVETLDRYGAVEEYRREIVKQAAIMKYPTLREPQAEPVYATAESLDRKRGELQNLKNVEIPANSRALQAAREMGDLRENFEYKAARARAEYLSARVGELASEISRVRVLDPQQLDTTSVRVGTKLELSNGDTRREVAILGPWESDPEHGVYSNESDVAKKLMGHVAGDMVSFMGNDYVIDTIRKWNE